MYKILIVDDNINFTKALSCLLREFYGDNITFIKIASNGKEAVAFAQSEQFDIIFMDADMPVMNGVEATKLIICKNRFAVIIAVSFHQEIEYMQEMLESGARYYLIKEEISRETVDACFKLIDKN